jgi:hypothetical protein
LGVKITRDGVVIVACATGYEYTDYVSVGIHTYCLIGVWEKLECNQSPANCFQIKVEEQCDPVASVTATVIGSDKVKVEWSGVGALGVVNYSVYRDGTELPNSPTTQTFIIDQPVDVGAHTYSVIVNYNKVACTVSEETFSNEIVIETCEAVANLQITSATTTQIVLTWTHTDAETFNVYRNYTLIATVDALTYTDAGTFAEGVIYNYCVEPVYATCQIALVCVEAYIEPCVPYDVTNVVLTPNQDDKKIVATWSYAGTGATFDILRNNKKIANVSTLTYTDTDVEYDVIYKYCIVPVAACPGGAMACNTTHIVTGIEELAGLEIYPNPANTHVTITGKTVVEVLIYNAIGQLIETIKSVDGESISKIDVSNYQSGAYVFKIHTADKAIVTKPIVVRH